jgi:hypothetical protein
MNPVAVECMNRAEKYSRNSSIIRGNPRERLGEFRVCQLGKDE